jgi:hypothetical protein
MAIAWLPFLAATACVAATTIFSLHTRQWMYTYNPRVEPYPDNGFRLFPDWSRAAPLPNVVFGAAYALLLLGYVLCHSKRVVLLRRTMLLWSAGQVVSIVQNVVTRPPDPNPLLAQNPSWSFNMYPVEYALGLLTVLTFPLPRARRGGAPRHCAAVLLRRVARWALALLSVLGVLLLIPTRSVYSIDAVSGVFAVGAVFFAYNWRVRSVASIGKRGAVQRWFEQDVLQLAAEAELAAAFGAAEALAGKKNAADSEGGDDESAGDGGPDSILVGNVPIGSDEKQAEDGAAAGGAGATLGGYGTAGAADPASAAAAGSGGGFFNPPTFRDARDRQSHEMRLVLLVHRAFDAARRRRAVALPLLACLVFGFAAAMLNELPGRYVSDNRAFAVPIARDVMFDLVPNPVDADAPDYLVWALVVVAVADLIFFAEMPIVTLRRTSLNYGVCMLVRSATIPLTLMVDPYPRCQNSQLHPVSSSCGALLFSGHSVMLLTLGLFLTMQRPWRQWAWHAAVWAYVAVGLLVIVISRLHYSRDVVMACLVTLTTFHALNALLFKRPDQALRYRALRWLEIDLYVAKAVALYPAAAAERDERSRGAPMRLLRHVFSQVRWVAVVVAAEQPLAGETEMA